MAEHSHSDRFYRLMGLLCPSGELSKRGWMRWLG
ncbi:hypothetical protein [Pantoea sp. B550]